MTRTESAARFFKLLEGLAAEFRNLEAERDALLATVGGEAGEALDPASEGRWDGRAGTLARAAPAGEARPSLPLPAGGAGRAGALADEDYSSRTSGVVGSGGGSVSYALNSLQSGVGSPTREGVSEVCSDGEAVQENSADDQPSTPRAIREHVRTKQIGKRQKRAKKPRTSVGASQAFGSLELRSCWYDLYLSNEIEAQDDDKIALILKRQAISKQPGMRFVQLEDSANGMNFVLRPTDRLRFLWDLIGTALLLHDIILIPLQVAFQYSQPVLFAVGFLIYWMFDIVMNFNTGYFGEGTLVLDRVKIAWRYLRRWLVFDVSLVLADVIVLAWVGSANGFQVLGGLRAFRLVRVLKIGRITDNIEELLARYGVQHLLITLSIAQIVGGILLAGHLLACAWYYIGRSTSEGWLHVFDDEGIEVYAAYLRSMYWVLGHMLAAPVDPSMSPHTDVERTFTVLTIFSSVLIVGSGISKMTNCIAELDRTQAEAKDIKRKLRRVLQNAGADADLSARVVRFALHSFSKMGLMSMEASVNQLLSKSLASEVNVSQRSGYLRLHPLFGLVGQAFPEVFMKLCSACRLLIFADNDLVFARGTLSENMYVTLQGKFALKTPIEEHASFDRNGEDLGNPSIDDQNTWIIRRLCDVHWLSEASMYTKVMYKSDLKTESFADALALSGFEFADCMRKTPKCIGLVYRYARALLDYMASSDEWSDGIIAIETAEGICSNLVGDSTHEEVDFHPAESAQLAATIEAFVADIAECRDWPCAEALVSRIVQCFQELHPKHGVYTKVNLKREQDTAICSIASVVWLLQGRYDFFVAPQNPVTRMSPELWADLQTFIHWADLDSHMVHTLLVFLVVRGLGKSLSFAKAMRMGATSPEEVVLELRGVVPGTMPSWDSLGGHDQLLTLCLNMHMSFNVAQMLQGENTPHQVAMLQNLVLKEGAFGARAFKLYLVAFVGVMCGLGARDCSGSKFLDQKTGTPIMDGLRVLQRLQDLSPYAVYWRTIVNRARSLSLPSKCAPDCAVARLACLVRANATDVSALKAVWMSLAPGDRAALTDHFLADGLVEPAYVLTFLPMYLANGRANAAVGLRRALEVLVELLEFLRIGGFADDQREHTITVDLQDLAVFARTVESPAVFMAVVVHSTLVPSSAGLRVVVGTKHKQNAAHVTWAADPIHETVSLTRQMHRKILAMEQLLLTTPSQSEEQATFNKEALLHLREHDKATDRVAL
uniref:Ion transport domain-containing protein n=1 Tax=Zooxanthella nutricula TaxID=1333877 RepID=A0A7S2JXJ8_9DINO|mmetsp:Transcript_38156/g.115361  ORF Transcript_38156/g.115361 Transcript_38156/m.115361 type:complete len:1229 (+) Transcript_38156:23-3709(+)